MLTYGHASPVPNRVSLGGLPEDLLIEIASRLDATDFCRLSLVSWQLGISVDR